MFEIKDFMEAAEDSGAAEANEPNESASGGLSRGVATKSLRVALECEVFFYFEPCERRA